MGRDRKGLPRRQVIGSGAAAGVAAGVAVALGGCASTQNVSPASPTSTQSGGTAPGGPGDELILVNGRIHTMDRANAIAKTVSIRNGRFIAVGDGAPARGARVIDLRGRTVIPASSTTTTTSS